MPTESKRRSNMAGGMPIHAVDVLKKKLKEAQKEIKELKAELEKYTGPKPHWDRWDYKNWHKKGKV